MLFFLLLSFFLLLLLMRKSSFDYSVFLIFGTFLAIGHHKQEVIAQK